MRYKSMHLVVAGIVGLAVIVIALRFATPSRERGSASTAGDVAAESSVSAKVGRLSSDQARSDDHVRLVASTRAKPTSAIPGGQAGLVSAEEQARMDRMAENLLKHADVDATGAARLREDWRRRYNSETERMSRMEIITEMTQLDQPETIHELLSFLASEQDAGVRQQAVLIAGYMHSSLDVMPGVNEALAADYKRCGDEGERLCIIQVEANLAGAHATEFIRAAFTASDATPQERSQAAQGLFQIARGDTGIDLNLLQQFTQRLQSDAQSAASAEERLLAMRALASPGQNNKSYFTKLLGSESDQENRKFLMLASREFPTE